MKIPSNIVRTLGGYNISNIEDKDIVILILATLHHNGRINDVRLNAMFNSLRKGTLLRTIKTYHNPINNSWYNDERMFNILVDTYCETITPPDMELDVFLTYLNRYYNANKNFCLNIVYFNYIKPLIERFESYPNYQILGEFGLVKSNEILTYEQAEMTKGLGDGYCCEDCDGDYEDYKQSRYQFNYKDQTIKHFKTTFGKHLIKLKTHDKNKFDKLNLEMSN